MDAEAPFGLARVTIRGFRSIRDLSFTPGPVCALVGESSAGKSNVLAAIWMLLARAPLRAADAALGGDGRIRVEATLRDGAPLWLEAVPPESSAATAAPGPAGLFLPGAARSGSVVAPAAESTGPAEQASVLIQLALAGAETRPAAEPALALIRAVEACCAEGASGLVLLIEEPELYLRPQAQRYLYRLLRTFAAQGNQVIYSTHAPAFLNVARLDELALVEHEPERGTTIAQPQPLPAAESFRALSEFDAERSELFLSRAALLVEGLTEKLVFPFVFQALGYDPDREAISIVECGGKANIPLFARTCAAVRVPFLVVHDRDASPDEEPIAAERAVNAAIEAVAGPAGTIVLAPDFEAVAGLHGHSHKPARAWQSFAGIGRRDVPPPLVEAVERAVALARR